jgi:hypothetical protein
MAARDNWRAFWGGFSDSFNIRPIRRYETPDVNRERIEESKKSSGCSKRAGASNDLLLPALEDPHPKLNLRYSVFCLVAAGAASALTQ